MADKYSVLVYDIPTIPGQIANPSNGLRRMCVRINLSCWLVKNGRIPHEVIESLDRGQGVRWFVTPEFAGDPSTMLQFCADNMQEDINKQCQRVNALLAEGPTTKGANGVPSRIPADVERWERNVRLAQERVTRLIEDSEVAAAEFGLDIGMRKATSWLQRLTNRIALRSAAYREAAESLDANDPLRDAANNQEVPAGILGDYVQDNGNALVGATLSELSDDE